MNKDALRKLGLLLKILGIIHKFDSENLKAYRFIDIEGNDVVEFDLKDKKDLDWLLYDLTESKINQFLNDLVLDIIDAIDLKSSVHNPDEFIWIYFEDATQRKARAIKERIKRRVLSIVKPFKDVRL